MVTDTKKLQLIKQITEIEDQTLIDQAKQNFQPVDKDEIDRLIQEADIQEPIEELLAMLRA